LVVAKEAAVTVATPVAVTVDVAVLTVRQGRLGVLAERDGTTAGGWRLPYESVRERDLDAVAASVLESAGGVAEARDALFVEQLRTYGPMDDGRISVAYVALVAESTLTPSSVSSGRVFALDDLHETGVLDEADARVLDDAVERVRAKLEYTTIATTLVVEPFTIPELRRVYETVWSVTLHPANFRRKVLATPGFVVADDDDQGATTVRRGPDLFRRGTAALLHPAMLRPVDAES
jgi:8-oxo-dGTP diphosphatase